MKSIVTRAFVRVLFLACLLPAAHAADRSKELPPRYRHWLNEEVNYIIDSNERREFLSLTTDVQRDSFIDAFWRIRNPDPSSAVNPYKEEHYKRLAYANERYGTIGRDDGWRTDRGRIYIILGPPKQVATYLSARNVRPMEIWFYQSPSLALSPYFSLIFYKRSNGEDFSLYSPLSDGPVRLVTGLEAMNDQKRSLDILRKSLGDEVATTAVSLLPGEPVDLSGDTYAPGMSSDLLLSEIAGLPDNPVTQEKLNRNRTREHVTMSLLIGGQDATISYAVFRDAQGRATLNYLMHSMLPDPRIVGKRADGTLHYDLALRTSVMTAENKPVYDQEDLLTGNLTEDQAEIAKKKTFGAEARVPLAPGSYTIVATLTNNLNQIATRQQVSVTVPEFGSGKLAFSAPLAYASPAAVKDPSGQLPFSIAGLRFTPRGAQNVSIRQGERLPLVFQLWLPPDADVPSAPERIHLHYVFGSLAASHEEASQEDEDVDAGNRDKAGNLLTGHTLDTSALMPGSYKVVVSAKQEGEARAAYATLNLHVVSPADYVETWTAYGPSSAAGEAFDDLKRGQSAEAQGRDLEAAAAFKRALTENPGDMRPLDNLAALLARKGTTDQLAALSQEPILTKTAASPATLLEIAGALSKSGNLKEIIRLLEFQTHLQSPSVDLYNALADAYQASGNANRAGEVRALAANLKK